MNKETFTDLQALWDEQSARIDRALAKSDLVVPLPRKKPHPSAPWRLRMLAAYAVFSAVALAAAVYWGILIPTLAFNTAALVVSLVVECIYLLLLAECLYWTVSLLVHDPARVGVLRMSRFIRRMHMEPRRAQSPDKPPFSIFNFPQAAAACVAALFALTAVSCTTTGIDGYAITQDHPGRAAAVEHVAHIIEQL